MILLSEPTSSWLLNKNASNRGAKEALATAYGFDHVSSSTNGIVNRLGTTNGNSIIDNSLEHENEELRISMPSSVQPHGGPSSSSKLILDA
jgi:hypothetical protein